MPLATGRLNWPAESNAALKRQREERAKIAGGITQALLDLLQPRLARQVGKLR